MRDLAQKFDNVGDTLSAAEFNSDQNEIENAVTSTGQTLDASGGPDTDLNMLGKAMGAYGSGANYYDDGGTANTYVLTKGSSTLKNPTVLFDGLTARFIVNTTNTGASTINVAGLGVKDLTDIYGGALLAGALIAGEVATVVYSVSAGDFLLVRTGTPITSYTSNANGYNGGFKALNVNGDFTVWQIGTTFTGLSASEIMADNWAYGYTFAAPIVHDASRSTNVPSGLEGYSLMTNCTTGKVTLDTDDLVRVRTAIEGRDFLTAYYNGYLMIGFWVYATKTGTSCLSVTNGLDRYYIAEFTINSSDTWEFKTILIPLDYTGGTWNYENGLGLQVNFILCAGSNYHGTANSWQSGLLYSTSNQVNHCDAASNLFGLKAVQCERGRYYTGFDYVSLEQDERRCQRYLVPFALGRGIIGNGWADTASNIYINFPVPTQMRSTPVEYSIGSAIFRANCDPSDGNPVVTLSTITMQGAKIIMLFDASGAVTSERVAAVYRDTTSTSIKNFLKASIA